MWSRALHPRLYQRQRSRQPHYSLMLLLFPTKSQLPCWKSLRCSTRGTSHSQFQFRWCNSWVMWSHNSPYSRLSSSKIWPVGPRSSLSPLWVQKCDHVWNKSEPAEYPCRTLGLDPLIKHGLLFVPLGTVGLKPLTSSNPGFPQKSLCLSQSPAWLKRWLLDGFRKCLV